MGPSYPIDYVAESTCGFDVIIHDVYGGLRSAGAAGLRSQRCLFNELSTTVCPPRNGTQSSAPVKDQILVFID